jgi:hypothetical protein
MTCSPSATRTSTAWPRTRSSSAASRAAILPASTWLPRARACGTARFWTSTCAPRRCRSSCRRRRSGLRGRGRPCGPPRPPPPRATGQPARGPPQPPGRGGGALLRASIDAPLRQAPEGRVLGAARPLAPGQVPPHHLQPGGPVACASSQARHPQGPSSCVSVKGTRGSRRRVARSRRPRARRPASGPGTARINRGYPLLPAKANAWYSSCWWWRLAGPRRQGGLGQVAHCRPPRVPERSSCQGVLHRRKGGWLHAPRMAPEEDGRTSGPRHVLRHLRAPPRTRAAGAAAPPRGTWRSRGPTMAQI